jgi:mannosyl-glycoprotein endo-beta-N-acetylglucosaminidase
MNLALHRPATGSLPCGPDQTPEKAVNGSVAGGPADRWCARDWPLFLQVDLGAGHPVQRFVVKHASAGGEHEDSDTREFNIQVSNTEKRSPRSLRRRAPGSSMSGPSIAT